MKQVVQSYRNGKVRVIDSPEPNLLGEGIIVLNSFSVISPGTERRTTEIGKKSLLGKAIARPDLARQVINTAKRYGPIQTYQMVKGRLNQSLPMGYSSAGIVVESNCPEFGVGDRVACAGGGYANHAEVVYVPKNLAAKIPDNVGLDNAAFGTLGAIALQGVRQSEVTIGDKVLVVGLGLIGMLTLQILRSSGCVAYGIDLDQRAVDLAITLGFNASTIGPANKSHEISTTFTNSMGFDVALITASTQSNEPVELAGKSLRDRGRMVVLGDVRVDIPRDLFYYKELDVRFSRSYGPGRYDATYEEKGIDYPLGYVRWTEKRNLEAFLHLLSTGSVEISALVSHRIPIQEAIQAYDLISDQNSRRAVGILFTYANADLYHRHRKITLQTVSAHPGKSVRVALIGAGNFSKNFLLPELKRHKDVELVAVVTGSGLTSQQAAVQYGFQWCSSNVKDVIDSPDIDAVIIATRHDTHAEVASLALRAGKHVFVEKPLAMNENQLRDVIEAAQNGNRYLAVGYNRRFSPALRELRAFFTSRETSPLLISYRINAGPVSGDHWSMDPEVGGGRIIGETCHFVDAITYLMADQPPKDVFAAPLPVGGSVYDSIAATLRFNDGSVSQILYAGTGDPVLPKERIEAFGGGMVAVIDDFKELRIGFDGRWNTINKNRKQEKGYAEEIASFFDVIRGKQDPLFSVAGLESTSITTFKILDSIRVNSPVPLFENS